MSMGAKILWSERLTLGPQHFQRQDLYHETRLLRMVSALIPNFWGVRLLQWNMEGLGHNMLKAQAMSLIFQDGEVYDAPATDLLPLPVDLTQLPQEITTFTIMPHFRLSDCMAPTRKRAAAMRWQRRKRPTCSVTRSRSTCRS